MISLLFSVMLPLYFLNKKLQNCTFYKGCNINYMAFTNAIGKLNTRVGYLIHSLQTSNNNCTEI
jgi:hypothetical protein